MPFYDFTCNDPSCQNVTEHFMKYSELEAILSNTSSAPPPMCPVCSWHTTYTPTFGRASDSQRFDPIVIHRDTNGNISYPGSSSDPTPSGYERIEITSLRQADNFVRQVNNAENALRRENLNAEHAVWQQNQKERRERIDAHIRTHSVHPRVRQLMEFFRTKVDQRREDKHRALLSRGVNFHIQALEFDASNRQAYNGPDTGFRGRK